MHPFSWPSLPSGTNAVDDDIPVARIADMLLAPGTSYAFNGQERIYPDIRLVYWCGGNPFHHHQDLNRLVAAWRRPEVMIVNETVWNGLARHADIVFPATTQMERNDIACSAPGTKEARDSLRRVMRSFLESGVDSRRRVSL